MPEPTIETPHPWYCCGQEMQPSAKNEVRCADCGKTAVSLDELRHALRGIFGPDTDDDQC